MSDWRGLGRDLGTEWREYRGEKQAERATKEAEHPIVATSETRGINHGANIFMCFITLGAWIPIYVLILLFAGGKSKTVVRG